MFASNVCLWRSAICAQCRSWNGQLCSVGSPSIQNLPMGVVLGFSPVGGLVV